MTNWFTAHLMHHTVGFEAGSECVGNQHAAFWLTNNLDSGAFRGAQVQCDKITVPLLTVGNWSSMALALARWRRTRLFLIVDLSLSVPETRNIRLGPVQPGKPCFDVIYIEGTDFHLSFVCKEL